MIFPLVLFVMWLEKKINEIKPTVIWVILDYWVPYSLKQLSSKMFLQEAKLGEMKLQKKGLVEGGVRRAISLLRGNKDPGKGPAFGATQCGLSEDDIYQAIAKSSVS